MIIQDIVPPESKKSANVSFSFSMGEIQTISTALAMASVLQPDPNRMQKMIKLHECFEYAHEQLRSANEEALKDGEP